MKAFKILVVLYDLDIGGAQNYTIGLMNEFVKLGNKVSLRILSDNLLLRDRLSGEIDLQVWPRKSKLDFAVLTRIKNDVLSEKHDGIISSYPIYMKLAKMFIKNKPLTIYPLHFTKERTIKSFLLNYLIFRLKSKNEIFLTSIENQTSYLTHVYKLKPGYFTQIHNGIDTTKFSLPPVHFNRKHFLQEKGINPDHKIILMVAGFRSEKRHADALDAFKILQSVNENVTLLCVGDNREKERDDLIQYVRKNKIENAKLYIASEAGNVQEYYWSSDVFTLTSNKVETFPISVLEAMACGLPCVLTDTGGASNIIKSDSFGKVVPVEKPDEIAKAWETVLSENNPDKKAEIRDYVVSNFSIRKAALQYLSLLDKKNGIIF